MIINRLRFLFRLLLIVLCVVFQFRAVAQDEASEEPEESYYKSPTTHLWINTYGNIRLTKRLFWIAQTHFRMEETENIPYTGQVAQIYNRHAISYLFSKKFNTSLGGVLRLNFNTSESNTAEQRNMVPEWRIWHQYQFAIPLSRIMVYHRLRIEHRWTRGFAEESTYDFRNRWRYMFKVKAPIGKHKLGPKTFYVSPEVELIMQSGKTVVDSPMEDLRLHTSFGYIINPRLTVATGFMYSQGQDLSDGAIYKQKWTMRFHVYFAPDFRKVKNKLPAIHMDD